MSVLPSKILDLRNWKITLPIGPARDATIIENPELQSFSHPEHFHVNDKRDAVCFSSFSGGSTSSGTLNPRSELREMFGKKEASWSMRTGVHTMTFTGSTLLLPTTRPSTVIGQIHRGADDVIEVRVWIPPKSSNIVVDVFHDKVNYGVLDSKYILGEKYTIKIVASNKVIKVYYNDMNNPKLNIPSTYTTCFFKAGSYIQCNPTKHKAKPNEVTESWIYSLEVTHTGITSTKELNIDDDEHVESNENSSDDENTNQDV